MIARRRPTGAIIVGERLDVHQHRAICLDYRQLPRIQRADAKGCQRVANPERASSLNRIDKNRRRGSFFDAPSSDERDMLYTGVTRTAD